jgi:hypothetical protein
VNLVDENIPEPSEVVLGAGAFGRTEHLGRAANHRVAIKIEMCAGELHDLRR